jgi:hypothetical protein
VPTPAGAHFSHVDRDLIIELLVEGAREISATLGEHEG